MRINGINVLSNSLKNGYEGKLKLPLLNSPNVIAVGKIEPIYRSQFSYV